uniref:Putative secreted protein n=1 Tax=Ixodes ricinus TaxID=34613 RepID=V5HA32_IXORI
MLLKIFTAVLISMAVQNGAISEVTQENNACLKLIEKIGGIACHLIGEKGYYRLGQSTCLISCTGGTYQIGLPDTTCDRIFEQEKWEGYLHLFHHLPPRKFEYCSDEWAEKLRSWLRSWQERNVTVYNSICNRRGK